ncbi:hypothetical protein [Streptomyces sp. NRRL WC-3742]|uniref:hypothetical protein n=1 Tax=Streptomyces sp. NRRL WC-3742 TaxID=1463934 RepID=UPI0004C5C23B|nr:hypothetical protein [Streptomyces sp. NRRL WC-3742]
MSAAHLQTLVDRVRRHERDWEATFRENIPTYDPDHPDQPAEDRYMGDYDEMDDSRAYDSRDLLLDLTAELEALIREMEGRR